MSLSMNEVEATAKKAARGAGYSWGLAEDAAKATRWLCRHGQDGCAELARLLVKFVDAPPVPLTQKIEDLSPNETPLCPIATGTKLAGQAHKIPINGWHLTNVEVPALLAPFAAEISQKTGQSIAITGLEFRAVTDGCHLMLQGQWPVFSERVDVAMVDQSPNPNEAILRASPSQKDWAILQTLAHRTYAPATEVSRLKGAGAGLNDND